MSQEDFELGVLYFYSELSDEEAQAFKARLDADHVLAAAYVEISEFLSAIPGEERAMPLDRDWDKIKSGFQREAGAIRMEKVQIKKAARLRMIWGFAVYAVIFAIGLYWFTALNAKPTDLVIQAYSTNAIVPGGETSIRLIARSRTGVKMSKERLKEYQAEVDAVFAESDKKSEAASGAPESKDEADSAKSLADNMEELNRAAESEEPAGSEAAPAPSVMEPQVFPSLEWNPLIEPIAERLRLEQSGLLANVPVRIVLSTASGREVLYKGKTNEEGTLDETFRVPDKVGENPILEVQAQHKGKWQTIALPVVAESNLKLTLNTDKSRYQPGQTIHIRALATDKTKYTNAAKTNLIFSIEAPDGTKLFRESKQTSDWGIASVDFQLADLVNLGEYTIGVQAGTRQESLVVKVDRYVLPPIKIEFETDKEWYKPGDEVIGTVTSIYYFGNPVSSGKASIKFTHFDFEEVVHGTSEGSLGPDGKYRFSFKIPEKLFIREEYSHQTEIAAEITITDGAGQSSKVNRTISVFQYPYIARMMPESGAWRGGVDNYVYVTLSTVDRAPWNPATVVYESPLGYNSLIRIAPGLYSGVISASDSGSTSRLTATDSDGNEYFFYFPNFDYSIRTAILLHTDKAVYEPGDTVKAKILLPASIPAVFLDVLNGNQIVLSKAAANISGIVDIEFTATPAMTGESEIRVFAPTQTPDEVDIMLRDRRTIFVMNSGKSFSASVEPAKPVYAPGDSAEVTIKLTDAAGNPAAGAVGLTAIDSKLFGVEDAASGLEKVYFGLLVDLLNPRIEIHASELSTVMASLPSADSVFEQIKEGVQEGKAEETLAQLNYTYQAVGRAISARKALLDSSWYEIEKTSSLDELERYNRVSEKARRNIENGLPLMILALTLIIFVLAVLQHALYAPAQPSKPLWLAYRKWTMACLIPLYLFAPATFIGSYWPIVAIAALGIILSALAGKIIGEQINLYRVKAMMLIAIYAVAGVLLSLLLINVLDFLDYNGPMEHILAGIFLLLPVFISYLFASNNLEHPYTGRTTKATTFALRVAGIVIVAVFLFAISMPNFITVKGGRAGDAMLDGFGAGAAPEANGIDKTMPDDLRLAATPASHTSGAPRVRRLFPETLFWAPEVIVDQSGETKYSFELADSITSWHISAIANDKSGNIATAETEIKSKTDFFIDLGLPVQLTRGDKISLPVIAYNYAPTQQSVNVTINKEEWFTLDGGPSKSITLSPGEVGSTHFTIAAQSAGKFKLYVSARTYAGLSDAIEREVLVVPDGKEVIETQNGRLENGTATFAVRIPDGVVAGSGKAQLKIYSGALGHIIDGIDGIFAMPHGCFEQTSSTTYPNVMALAYLKNNDLLNPELEMKALGYISLGYQRLVTFEVEGGGFDWFGDAPADVLLTAYGLMEFVDMADVSYVDPDLISRTSSWLREQAQPGTGLYKVTGSGREGESSSGGELGANAYIAWALAKAGVKRGEIFNLAGYITDGAKKTDDPHALAITINALALLSDSQEVLDSLRKRLAEMSKTDDEGRAYWAGKGQTLVLSGGYTADVETTALSILALVDSPKHTEHVDKALGWLAEKKQGGTWGSTYATVAALKAFIAAGDKLTYRGKGTLSVKAGGEVIKSFEVGPENRDVTNYVEISSSLSGSTPLEIRLEDTNEKSNLLYQVESRYNIPWSDYRETAEVRPLELDVKYDRSELMVNDSVRVEVTAAYKGAGETGMVVIDLPIPPGFDVWSPDFDELVGSSIISKWENSGRQIIVYLRSLKRDETVVFRYRLKALFPVEASAPPAKIYEYYKPENERITKPQQLTVT